METGTARRVYERGGKTTRESVMGFSLIDLSLYVYPFSNLGPVGDGLIVSGCCPCDSVADWVLWRCTYISWRWRGEKLDVGSVIIGRAGAALMAASACMVRSWQLVAMHRRYHHRHLRHLSETGAPGVSFFIYTCKGKHAFTVRRNLGRGQPAQHTAHEGVLIIGRGGLSVVRVPSSNQ